MQIIRLFSRFAIIKIQNYETTDERRVRNHRKSKTLSIQSSCCCECLKTSRVSRKMKTLRQLHSSSEILKIYSCNSKLSSRNLPVSFLSYKKIESYGVVRLENFSFISGWFFNVITLFWLLCFPVPKQTILYKIISVWNYLSTVSELVFYSISENLLIFVGWYFRSVVVAVLRRDTSCVFLSFPFFSLCHPITGCAFELKLNSNNVAGFVLKTC